MQLIFFCKNDCAPCGEKKPLVEHLAEMHDVPLQVLNLDEDPEAAALAKQYQVRAVPTVIVTSDNGNRLAGFTAGLINHTSLERTLAIYRPHREPQREQ